MTMTRQFTFPKVTEVSRDSQAPKASPRGTSQR